MVGPFLVSIVRVQGVNAVPGVGKGCGPLWPHLLWNQGYTKIIRIPRIGLKFADCNSAFRNCACKNNKG